MLTGYQLYNIWRKNTTQFAGQIPELTAEEFNTKGVSIVTSNPNMTGDFYNVTMTWRLDNIMGTSSTNILEAQNGVMVKDIPWGDMIQMLFLDSKKPINPRYTNLQDGNSVDMQVIRKLDLKERWFRFNFNYQNHITLPGMWNLKTIFANSYGVDMLEASAMEGLDAEYNEAVMNAELETLYKGTNSPNAPLRQSQIMSVPNLTEGYTNDDVYQFVKFINQLTDFISNGMRHGGFNAMGYRVKQDRSHLALYVRSGFKAIIGNILMTVAATRNELSLAPRIIELPSLGGAIPYATYNEETNTYTDRLYPVYSDGDKINGAVIGYAKTQGATAVEYTDEQVEWADPEPATLGYLMDDRAIFRGIQNPRQIMAPPFNTSGLYQNLDDNAPHQLYGYDPARTTIKLVQEGINNPAVARAMVKASRKARTA